MASEDDQREIEQAFIASWDRVEQLYEPHFNQYEGVRKSLILMSKLRKRGCDRQFRAATSLMRFTLSRSRIYGLRREQPSLVFDLFSPKGGMEVSYIEPPDKSIQLQVKGVEITPEVDDMLKRLLAHPMD